MVADALLKEYSIVRMEFQNTHSAGTLISYDHPCIGFLKKGTGTFLYNGTTYFAEAGDLVYIAKGTKYYSVWSGTPEIVFYSINYDFLSRMLFIPFDFRLLSSFPRRILTSSTIFSGRTV